MAENQNYLPSTFRTTAEQRDAFRTAAKKAGMTTSAWIRDICLAAAGASVLTRQMGVARERHEAMVNERMAERAAKRRARRKKA